MTATAVTRRPSAWGSDHHARHGVLKILRGAAWKAGWLIVKHDDRLMPYPTSGFNSAVTKANGGPMQQAGADANGGLRIIARQPNITITIANGGAVAVAVAGTLITLTAVIGTTTAAAARAALLADARVNQLIDVAYTGDGTGTILTVTNGAIPHVVPYGISKTERSNADDSTNDNALILGDPEEMFEFGAFGFIVASTPAVPSTVYLSDNQTVTQDYAALLLPLQCISYEDSLAICRIA